MRVFHILTNMLHTRYIFMLPVQFCISTTLTTPPVRLRPLPEHESPLISVLTLMIF